MSERIVVPTVECFVRKNDTYLMLHRSQDKRIMPGIWIAPGGKIEPSEGVITATKREVREETGLTIRYIQLRGLCHAYLKDLQEEVFVHILTADYVSGDLINSPDGELKWLTVIEILQLDNLLAELHKIIPAMLKNSHELISCAAVYEKGNILTELILEDRQ